MKTLQKIDKLLKDNVLQSAFITQALTEYADKVLSNKEQVLKELEKSFINGDNWIKCAEQVKQVFK